jgi:RHS repeat-associated protein
LSSGLFYNVNRWYEPSSSRYLQPDPLGSSEGEHDALDAGDPNGFTAMEYSYVNNNPLGDDDPLGLSRIKDCRIVASRIKGILIHAVKHYNENKSANEPCKQLAGELLAFQRNNCGVYFPVLDRLAEEFFDKFCKGPPPFCSPRPQDKPWYEKLNDNLNRMLQPLCDACPSCCTIGKGPVIPGPLPLPFPVFVP